MPCKDMTKQKNRQKQPFANQWVLPQWPIKCLLTHQATKAKK